MTTLNASNPVEILLESTRKISPTLISYDIGSLFELFVYTTLKKAQTYFDKMVLLSFYDAFHIIYQYWKVNLSSNQIKEVMKNIEVVSVNSLYADSVKAEISMMITAPSRLIADISRRIEEELADGKEVLLFFVGLDLYALNRGEEDFRKLFSLLMLLSNKMENVSVATVLNKNVFSSKTIEFLNSYSFNVVHLKADVIGVDVRYYIEFKRVAMLKYNLNVWEYKLAGNTIKFIKRRVG